MGLFYTFILPSWNIGKSDLVCLPYKSPTGYWISLPSGVIIKNIMAKFQLSSVSSALVSKNIDKLNIFVSKSNRLVTVRRTGKSSTSCLNSLVLRQGPLSDSRMSGHPCPENNGLHVDFHMLSSHSVMPMNFWESGIVVQN